MPSSYVLVNIESGAEDFVLNQIKSIQEVKEAFVTFGMYDLIAKVSADTMDELKGIVCKIRIVDKIISTLTLLMLEE
jgi:DNA-binding Lrp family transcriptional regulator